MAVVIQPTPKKVCLALGHANPRPPQTGHLGRANLTSSPSMELQDSPHRPIPNTGHIRFPNGFERQKVEAWVRIYTRRGFDLRNMELVGTESSKRSMVKGLKRAVQLQQELLLHENWDGTPKQN